VPDIWLQVPPDRLNVPAVKLLAAAVTVAPLIPSVPVPFTAALSATEPPFSCRVPPSETAELKVLLPVRVRLLPLWISRLLPVPVVSDARIRLEMSNTVP